MKKAITDQSIIVTDPAGRMVKVLKEAEAKTIAQKADCELLDVYMAALKMGICPYRYLRNMASLSMADQLRLAESRVAVVGAGGLGGTVILLLARCGVGHLVVADHDVFDETNLNRQALCSVNALGKPKAETAVSVVASINPGTLVTPHRTKLNAGNAASVLEGCQVVVDALDNVDDRIELEEAAKKHKIPMVHGALAGFEGQCMTVFPSDRGLSLLYGQKGSKAKKEDTPEAILGVPTMTPAFIGTLQAMEVLKIILNRGEIISHGVAHADLEFGLLERFSFESAK